MGRTEKSNVHLKGLLKNFKESYEFKLKNGISLLKKKKLDEQK